MIKGIKYFGPYEGEDMRLFSMFDEMESRCTLCIARAKEGLGEAAAWVDRLAGTRVCGVGLECGGGDCCWCCLAACEFAGAV